MKSLFLLVFIIQSLAFGADQNSNTSTVTAPTKKDDVDQEITNARLRAATGAKATFSLQSSFTYNGSSVDHPFAKSRPKLTPGTVDNDSAKLTGNISAKWRATSRDNINLGFGVGWLTPMYEGQTIQAENPYIAYGRTFKFGNVQNVLNVSVKKYTAIAAVKKNLNVETDIDHTFLTNIGSSKAQIGLTFAWYREFYTSLVSDTQDKVAMYPFFEYPFSEKVSFRTVFRTSTFYNKTSAPNTWIYDDPSQSLGLGLSLARDLYFYPNVQWVWSDMRPEKTNVAVTAYVNL